MITSIKQFKGIPVSVRRSNTLKYTDLVSYASYLFVFPCIPIHLICITPFVGLNLLLSYWKMDALSELLESTIRYISTLLTRIYKYSGYLISILLCGVYYSLLTYKRNAAIIDAMNPVTLDNIKFSGLPNVHRNAIIKNGFTSVWWKNVVMFSAQPLSRYLLMYNPFLFNLELSFTNHYTQDLPIAERTTENFQILEMIFHSYAGLYKETKRSDAIRFNPNYTECDFDDGRFDDIGMQVCPYYTTYIQMELPKFKKGPERFDYQSPIIEDGIKCKLLDRLWLPYSNPFHPIISYVEMILTENGSLQHPMMGVFSDAYYCDWMWKAIDKLFQINVVSYLEEQYKNSKAIPIEIISNIE